MKSPNVKNIIISLLLVLPAYLQANSITADVRDTGSDSGLKNVVVIATPLTHTPKNIAPRNLLVDQIDKEFVNEVTVINVGDSINFPNKDDIRHHVYSFSKAKLFELPLYEGTPANSVVFDKPGLVKLGCNIHDWMFAYIYVSSSPYYGITNKEGKASIEGLPDGSYDIQIWHSQLKATEQSITRMVDIKGNDTAALEWEVEVKSHFRPRRAPMSIRRQY